MFLYKLRSENHPIRKKKRNPKHGLKFTFLFFLSTRLFCTQCLLVFLPTQYTHCYKSRKIVSTKSIKSLHTWMLCIISNSLCTHAHSWTRKHSHSQFSVKHCILSFSSPPLNSTISTNLYLWRKSWLCNYQFAFQIDQFSILYIYIYIN